MTYSERDLVATIEHLAGADLGALTQTQLDGLDQFHVGGAEAVDRLLPSLGLTSGQTVLDVGSGFGGPARQVARMTGCQVVGVDITQAYVDAATALTATAGLSEQVEFVCADIAPARTQRLRRGVHHARPDERCRQASVLRRDLRPATTGSTAGHLRDLPVRGGGAEPAAAVVDRRQ